MQYLHQLLCNSLAQSIDPDQFMPGNWSAPKRLPLSLAMLSMNPAISTLFSLLKEPALWVFEVLFWLCKHANMALQC